MSSFRFRLVPSLVLCCMLWGCDRPDEADVQLPDLPSPAAIKAAENELVAKTEQSKQRLQLIMRQEVLKVLGAIAEWQVSTDKEGKPDEALVKAKQQGAYDAVLQKAFTNRGLTLKFFSGVPYAVRALRAAEPQPETCDLICETPTPWKNVGPLLNTPGEITSDTDAAGQPREWHRYSEVSFGVVDNAVTTVRLHLTSKTTDWVPPARR